MNKTTRTLAMSGIAVAAGLTMGVGPASAAPATTSTTTNAASSSDHRFDDGRVVGYYRTASACFRAGKVGEFRNKWDDSDCDVVRRGFHRGQWQLTVSWDRHGNGHHGNDWDDKGNRGNGHRGHDNDRKGGKH
jgi:hypothetical protein